MKFKVGDKVKLVRYLDDISEADEFYKLCIQNATTLQIYRVDEDEGIKYPYRIDHIGIEGEEGRHSSCDEELVLVENYVEPKRLASWSITC